jgi:hypothetical protein
VRLKFAPRHTRRRSNSDCIVKWERIPLLSPENVRRKSGMKEDNGNDGDAAKAVEGRVVVSAQLMATGRARSSVVFMAHTLGLSRRSKATPLWPPRRSFARTPLTPSRIRIPSGLNRRFRTDRPMWGTAAVIHPEREEARPWQTRRRHVETIWPPWVKSVPRPPDARSSSISELDARHKSMAAGAVWFFRGQGALRGQT